MQRGYHWIGNLPDGRYALLYADPVLKKTHTEIATFTAHIDAIKYCRKNRITLATAQRLMAGAPKMLTRELPRNQQLLYDALLNRADDQGIARGTARELMSEARIKDRSMFSAVMNTLYFKGFVTRTEAGWGDEPSTYQLAKQKKPPSEEDGQEPVGSRRASAANVAKLRQA